MHRHSFCLGRGIVTLEGTTLADRLSGRLWVIQLSFKMLAFFFFFKHLQG